MNYFAAEASEAVAEPTTGPEATVVEVATGVDSTVGADASTLLDAFSLCEQATKETLARKTANKFFIVNTFQKLSNNFTLTKM